MQAEVLKQVRALGIKMGSRQLGAFIGYTSDREKSLAAADAGARVMWAGTSSAPGWEIIAVDDPPEMETTDDEAAVVALF
jgi:hypothetical protein